MLCRCPIRTPKPLLFLTLFLAASLAPAQVCTPGPHGWTPTGTTTNDGRNCVNIYACYAPQLEPVEYVTTGGCDPTAGPCAVRAQVRATFRGNHLNQTASPPYPGSPIWLSWTDGRPSTWPAAGWASPTATAAPSPPPTRGTS